MADFGIIRSMLTTVTYIIYLFYNIMTGGMKTIWKARGGTFSFPQRNSLKYLIYKEEVKFCED
jgi:hypothetical protein